VKKKFIIATLVPLFVLSFVTELSFSQLPCKSKTIKTESIDPECAKVIKITGWNLDTAEYFVFEARVRKVSVFEEILPIISVETGNKYDFNLIHHNEDGTSDYGAFQINDVTYDFIIKQLKEESREFDSWDKLNPELNIAVGMYWVSHLKNNYGLKNDHLFTAYNMGVTGAMVFVNRNGNYRSGYAQKVETVKESFKDY
jgi:hypothetical protein